MKKSSKSYLTILLRILAVSLAISVGHEAEARSKLINYCVFKGHKLYGKVKIVKYNADLKIAIDNNFPDLKVKFVENFPNSCGKWKIVKNFPDFTVQFVKNFSDFKVKFVENFPGIRH